MPRYTAKDRFQVGPYWLSRQSRSPAWCRTWYDAAAQQTRRASLGTTDFEHAKLKLTDWFVLQHQNKDEAATNITLASLFARYYEHHGQKLKSAGLVQIALRYWLEFYKDKTLAAAAEITQQERFHAWLLESKGLKPNSAARIISNGKTAINWAWKRGEIDRVPHFMPVKNIGVVPPRGRPLEVCEIARLINAATEPHLRNFILLMLATASRPDAIFELKFSQCDFENGIIQLNAPNRTQTKKHRPTVKMPERLKSYLKNLMDTSSSDYVISYRGRPVKNLRTMWRTARLTAGLDDQVNPYSLRHTVARHLRKSSVPAWEVAAQLGHKVREASTTEIYAPFDPSYLSQAKQAIDALFSDLTCEFRVNELADLKSLQKLS